MPVIEFPVQIHIGRRSDGTGGITATQVDQMLVQLNNDFVDAGFEFSQCASINYVDSDTYYDYDQTEESAVTNPTVHWSIFVVMPTCRMALTIS